MSKYKVTKFSQNNRSVYLLYSSASYSLNKCSYTLNTHMGEQTMYTLNKKLVHSNNFQTHAEVCNDTSSRLREGKAEQNV